MTSPKEIIGFVKHLRGRLGEPLKGKCTNSMQIADQFNGQHWRSEIAIDYPEQPRLGHSVAIVPTRGDGGVIVDFTNSEAIIIGSVSDIKNEKLIATTLHEITGCGGWYNRDKVDQYYLEKHR